MLVPAHQLVQQITELQRATVCRWHTQEIDNPYDGLLATVCEQHRFNYLLKLVLPMDKFYTIPHFKTLF